MKIHILYLLLFVWSVQTFGQQEVPKAQAGVMDLSNWYFSKKNALSLDGEWEFYWKKVLSPEDFVSQKQDPSCLINLPKEWNNLWIDGEKIGGFGYATYRLNVKINPKDTALALRINRINVAYKLFINGELRAEEGRFGVNEDEVKAINRTHVVPFKTRIMDNEIILQVANYHHNRGGVLTSIEIGSVAQTGRQGQMQIIIDFFLFGVLLIMAAYHIGLYLLRPKDFSALYFALFCVVTAAHQAVNGQMAFSFVFPDVNWELMQTINFLGNYLRLATLLLFLLSLFKDEFCTIFMKILLGVLFGMSALVLVTPAPVYTKTLIVFLVLVVISIGYFVYGLTKAVINRREGAVNFITATGILILFAINDLLYDQHIINTGFFLPIGLFIFIFFQSFILSARFSKAFNDAESMTVELNFINKNLEKIVEERLEEVETQKMQLMETNEELRQQKEEIQSIADHLGEANTQITTQRDEIQESHKQIKNSIQYAKRIQSAMLPVNERFEEYFDQYFIFFRPRDIVSGDFYWMKKIDNYLILVVADSTGHGVPGALISMLGISLLNDIVGKKGVTKANEVLEVLREQIKIALNQTGVSREQKEGMDLALCAIDLNTHEMQYAGANNPLFLFKKTEKAEVPELIHIKPNTQPISVYRKETPFTNHVIQLTKGDTIYLFTDGYTDQFGHERKEKYKTKRFKELLENIQKKELSEQKQIVETEFDEWKGQEKQIDDVLVLGILI